MPRAPVPEGETEESWLVKEVERGLHLRFPHGVTEQYRKQADYEVGVIIQMGFPGYFLVTADLIQHAKSVGIRCGPGRGSAAGSLVAYVLGITDLDPIQHKLIFERFLNPERISMPDIDMDFDERRRGEMIRYTTEKYGEDRIAQIITYSTIKAKAAIKDSARVLFGQPGYAVADRISKAMPPAVMGKDIPLSGVFDPAHKRYSEATEVRALYESDPQVKEIIDTARGLEGLKRQWGVHAAGVIMSSKPLIDVIPIQRRDSDGAIITQFDMGACETLGLLKMDFLGLRNLTIIDDALENIELNGKPKLEIESVPLDDPKTYELLARGDTLGVFQLDGGPMRDLLRRMAPTEFDDISAVGALYRPGPMGANAHNDYADRKNGRQEVTPIHPELAEPLKDILGETYGLIVYQEQVMAIAQKLAGYSLGKADLLRRAMGKKKKEILDKEYAGFAQGMKDNGYSGRRGQDALGHPAPVLRLRVQPRPLRGVRRGLVLDRLPQGQLPGRVHGRACSPPSATTRTRPRSTWPSAAAWASRCCRPTSTSRCATSPRSATTSGSASAASATSASTSSTRSSRPARRRASSPTSPTSCARSTRWSATRRSSSR